VILIRVIYVTFCILILLNACSPPPKTCEDNEQELEAMYDSIVASKKVNNQETFTGIDLSIQNPNLVDIQKIDTSIQIELRYATTNNFMGKVMYDSIRQVFLQKEVASKLKKVQTYLKTLYPSYSLLVYDGVRPIHVQQKMWDALDSIPAAERGKFLSNPQNGSVHNYGAAVDLTIIDANKKPLDMGADYDDIRKIAYPSLESEFLVKGELTTQQIDNRKLLRKVMSYAGFRGIPSEWWHFNSCSREEAKKKYQLIR
jgi:D-alanyl-D-alanine dipeptidase